MSGIGLPTTLRSNRAVCPSEHLKDDGFCTNTGLYSLSSWASSVSSSLRAGERPGERLAERGEVDLKCFIVWNRFRSRCCLQGSHFKPMAFSECSVQQEPTGFFELLLVEDKVSVLVRLAQQRVFQS